MERTRDWPELRANLARNAGSDAAAELDRLLATGRKVQAIRLLRKHGVALVDPARPASPRD